MGHIYDQVSLYSGIKFSKIKETSKIKATYRILSSSHQEWVDVLEFHSKFYDIKYSNRGRSRKKKIMSLAVKPHLIN